MLLYAEIAASGTNSVLIDFREESKAAVPSVGGVLPKQ